MSTSTLASIGAGTLFGAALTASGVYSPWIIVSQMKLVDFHMLITFLTASATSAVAMVVAKRASLSSCKPREASTLGWFHGYDGNIVGSLLTGIGMTLTGACPGTVLVQVATGVRSGYLALAGGLIGGILYVQLGSAFRKTVPKDSVIANKLTVYDRYGIKESQAVLTYEIACLAVILLATFSSSNTPNVIFHPIIGGLLIGGSQATSLALTGNAVGVSSAYEQIGHLFQWTWNSGSGTKELKDKNFPKLGSAAFAGGIIAGALILSRVFPAPIPGGEISIPALRALLGGGVMVFGSRLAGGCTSGHGISGMATLSISSIISVVSMFTGGIASATLIR